MQTRGTVYHSPTPHALGVLDPDLGAEAEGGEQHERADAQRHRPCAAPHRTRRSTKMSNRPCTDLIAACHRLSQAPATHGFLGAPVGGEREGGAEPLRREAVPRRRLAASFRDEKSIDEPHRPCTASGQFIVADARFVGVLLIAASRWAGGLAGARAERVEPRADVMLDGRAVLERWAQLGRQAGHRAGGVHPPVSSNGVQPWDGSRGCGGWRQCTAPPLVQR